MLIWEWTVLFSGLDKLVKSQNLWWELEPYLTDGLTLFQAVGKMEGKIINIQKSRRHS